MNYIGRIAFPIFAFQISEGYLHTKSLKNYFLRLLVFALFSQIPFALFCTLINEKSFLHNLLFDLNVFFTLLLGLLSIWLWDKSPNKFVAILGIIACSMIAFILNTDYSYWGVLLVFVFYICKNNKMLTFSTFFLACILKYIPYLISYTFYYKYCILMLFTFGAIVPILLYNGKQGKKIKYFLYAFYPMHLLFLYLVHVLI